MNNKELFDRTWVHLSKMLVLLAYATAILAAFIVFIMFIPLWISLPALIIGACVFVSYAKAKDEMEFEENRRASNATVIASAKARAKMEREEIKKELKEKVAKRQKKKK